MLAAAIGPPKDWAPNISEVSATATAAPSDTPDTSQTKVGYQLKGGNYLAMFLRDDETATPAITTTPSAIPTATATLSSTVAVTSTPTATPSLSPSVSTTVTVTPTVSLTPAGTIVVKVVDAQQNVYRNLTVKVYDGDTDTGVMANTDASGQASLALPATGTYRFHTFYDGQDYFSSPNNTCAAGSCTTAAIILDPLMDPVAIERHIVYGYDNLNRLKSASYDNVMDYQYSYDADGNITSEQSATESYNLSYDDAVDHITKIHDVLKNTDTTLSWDNNGNLTQYGQKAYHYDLLNRLDSLTQDSKTATFQYDGLGNRYSMTFDGATTKYTLDSAGGLSQVVQDSTTNNGKTLSNTYFYGLSRISQTSAIQTSTTNTSQTAYFLPDALGSVRQMADDNENILFAQDFSPYGEPNNGTNLGMTSYGFTGEQTDPSGLVYLRARYYSPDIARFISTDPVAGDPNNPVTFNPWQYGADNPLINTDPSGMCNSDHMKCPKTVTQSSITSANHDGRGYHEVTVNTSGSVTPTSNHDGRGYHEDIISTQNSNNKSNSGKDLVIDSLLSIEDPNRNPQTAAFNKSFWGGVYAWGDSFKMYNDVLSYTGNSFDNGDWNGVYRGLSSLGKMNGTYEEAGITAGGQFAYGVVTTPLRLGSDLNNLMAAADDRRNGKDRTWDILYSGAMLEGDVAGTFGIVKVTGVGDNINFSGQYVADSLKTNSEPVTYSRYMSFKEVKAIADSGGYLRGGRSGETFFTTQKYAYATNAQQWLALPVKPEVRVDFNIINSPEIQGPYTVKPRFGQIGIAGNELISSGPIQVSILNIISLK